MRLLHPWQGIIWMWLLHPWQGIIAATKGWGCRLGRLQGLPCPHLRLPRSARV